MKKSITKSTVSSPPALPGAEQSSIFPIVGFGASAGGVEAFTQFLQAIPEKTGMGFVLVQHLDAKHGSMLVDILQRASKLPIAWATHNLPVERDHVYVIPPTADLDIHNGKLQLKARSHARIPHLPVDRFLESLARDRGSVAIGVILSGTASDGTLGLKAIKAEGGITFAQSESSAKYSGMPSSAIFAGVVDYILPPDGIARELARIRRHPYLHLPEPLAEPLVQESDGELSTLFTMLRGATGVDFTHYKQTTVRRRIARRMVVRKIERLPAYLEFIRKNPAELQALYQDILINVTGFFRDPGMYRGLKRSVFPRLVRKRSREDPVRIWIPGCSTGEEAYSLAIAFSEYMRGKNDHFPIQIFATDVSDVAIDKARAGMYPENIAAEVAPDLLRRYFQAVDGTYQISRPLREMCVFARQNVAQDAPFSKVDLISCRNLMIYLGPVLQRRVINVFHYALKPSGFLVLGTSETIGALSELFSIVDKKNKIYLKKPGASRLSIDFQVPAPPPPVAAAGRPAVESSAEPGREADRILLNRYAPPGVIIDDSMRVLQFRGRTGRFLEPEPGEPNLNLLRMARQGLMPALRNAITQAKRKGMPVRVNSLRVYSNSHSLVASVEVIPFAVSGDKPQNFLVLFEEAPKADTTVARGAGRPATKAEQRELSQVKQELGATKQYLQSIIEEQEANNEELKSANEEIQSSNEELQSINEEMETAKEELQSTNEELTTVNEELNNRNIELAQANNDLNNLISSIQLPLAIVDNDGRLRRFTPAAEKLLNLIPSDVGRPLYDIKPNIDLPDLREVVQDVIDNLHTFEREVQDHKGRAYSMWVRPYRTEERKIEGAVLAFVDVSALKLSLAQTRDQREYAEALAATVREPLIALDSDLRVIAANAPFFSTFHLSKEETENQGLFNIAGGAWDIPRLRALLASKIAGDGFTQGIEVQHEFGAAGAKVLSINLRRLPGDGDLRMVLMAIEDISERRRVEESLRDALARYSALAREAPVGILQTNAKGECSFANTHAAGLARVTPKEALGHGWMKHILADDLQLLKTKLEDAAQGDEGFSIELRFVYPGGETAWAHVILIPLKQVARKATEYLIALTDIRGRKDLEDRLAQAQKMEAVGRLAGGVAHDFNNMLTAISSYATRLLDLIPEDNPARITAVQINKLAEQSALVTRQLLAFSRKQVLHPRRADINMVLHDMNDLLARMLGEGVEVHLSLKPDAGCVMVDLAQLQQVILNLAINARDAMAEGGKLTISTEKVTLSKTAASRDSLSPGDYVILSVQDTGLGMDMETQERMFEPFFTTKPPGEGTGLGLSTAYGIIKQSGGMVRVESAPHKGSTFHIYLPRARGDEEKQVRKPAAAQSGGSETVLVVEDAAVVRSLVRELLEQRGYKVIEAGDAREAIAAAESQTHIDLLLTDVVMPGMNGHDLANRLRRRRKQLKVIYMSGYSGESLQAIEKEANFLEKPFKPNVLADLVRKVLDKK